MPIDQFSPDAYLSVGVPLQLWRNAPLFNAGGTQINGPESWLSAQCIHDALNGFGLPYGSTVQGKLASQMPEGIAPPTISVDTNDRICLSSVDEFTVTFDQPALWGFVDAVNAAQLSDGVWSVTAENDWTRQLLNGGLFRLTWKDAASALEFTFEPGAMSDVPGGPVSLLHLIRATGTDDRLSVYERQQSLTELSYAAPGANVFIGYDQFADRCYVSHNFGHAFQFAMLAVDLFTALGFDVSDPQWIQWQQGVTYTWTAQRPPEFVLPALDGVNVDVDQQTIARHVHLDSGRTLQGMSRTLSLYQVTFECGGHWHPKSTEKRAHRWYRHYRGVFTVYQSLEELRRVDTDNIGYSVATTPELSNKIGGISLITPDDRATRLSLVAPNLTAPQVLGGVIYQ